MLKEKKQQQEPRGPKDHHATHQGVPIEDFLTLLKLGPGGGNRNKTVKGGKKKNVTPSTIQKTSQPVVS